MTSDSTPPLTSSTADPTSSADAHVHDLEAQVTQLREQMRQVTELFQHSPTATFHLDRQGQVMAGNVRGHELFGVSAGTLRGRTFGLLLAPGAQGTFLAVLDRVRRTGERQRTEVQVPGDVVLDFLLEISPDGPGVVPGFQVTLTDVTAYKDAQRDLLDLHHVQEGRIQESDLRTRQLTEEFESVMRVSEQHLQVRLTRAENYLARYRKSARPGDLDHVQQALKQTQNLLGSLEKYMQLRFLRTRVRRVSLDQVWREAVKEAAPELRDRDVQITGAALPALDGDSQVFKIILGEYLMNALKFTRAREQARVHVIVEETATEYRIGVQDNGVGFNMRQKDRAFELFGRLHTDEYEGTGLGLAVVRRLCERFGTRAWAEGKVDEGATFWFAWPKITR